MIKAGPRSSLRGRFRTAGVKGPLRPYRIVVLDLLDGGVGTKGYENCVRGRRASANAQGTSRSQGRVFKDS